MGKDVERAPRISILQPCSAYICVLLVNDKFNWLFFEGFFEDLHCCNATDATSYYDYSNWSWFSDVFFVCWYGCGIPFLSAELPFGSVAEGTIWNVKGVLSNSRRKRSLTFEINIDGKNVASSISNAFPKRKKASERSDKALDK